MQRPPPLVWETFSFGPDRAVEVSRVANPIKGRAPIVVWVPAAPGLGAQARYNTDWLDSFVYDRGAILMTLSFKVRTGVSAAAHVERVAAALAEIARRAPGLDCDPSRIVLVGQGWGGAVAALLATDPTWLETAGVPFTSIKGALIIDGGGLDVARPGRSKAWQSAIERAFDGAEARVRLSPVAHAESPNAPSFLLIAPPGDEQTLAESEAFAAAVAAGGSRAELARARRSRPYIWHSNLGHPTNAEYGRMKRFFLEALGLSR